METTAAGDSELHETMEKAPRGRLDSLTRPRVWHAAALALIPIYTIVGGVVGRHLTFFWDDVDIVLSFRNYGLSAILQGEQVHWFPLGKILLLIEYWAFGNFYPGYTAVAALELAVGFYLLYRATGLFESRSAWLGTMSMAMILFVPGSLAVVMIAMNAGPLIAFTLAALAALLLAKEQPWFFWVPVLALAFLASSGSAVIYSLILAAAVLFRDLSRRGRTRPRLLLLATVVVSGVCWTLVGSSIAARNQTDMYRGVGKSVPSMLDTAHIVEVVQTWVTVFFGWLAAPLIPGVLAPLHDGVTRLLFLLRPLAPVLIVVTLALMIVTSLRRFPRLRDRSLLSRLLLIVSGALFAVIVYGRPSNVFTERYQPMWLPVVLLVWLSVRSGLSGFGRFARGFTHVLVSLLVATTIVVLVSLPWTIRHAADIDRPRWQGSADQVAAARACVDGAPQNGFKDLSGVFDGEDICHMADYLSQLSPFPWAGP